MSARVSTIINGEQRIARFHVATDLDENFGNDPSDVRAERNIFRAGLDEPGASYKGWIRRLRRF